MDNGQLRADLEELTIRQQLLFFWGGLKEDSAKIETSQDKGGWYLGVTIECLAVFCVQLDPARDCICELCEVFSGPFTGIGSKDWIDNSAGVGWV